MAENWTEFRLYSVLIFWVDDYSAFEADSPKTKSCNV